MRYLLSEMLEATTDNATAPRIKAGATNHTVFCVINGIHCTVCASQSVMNTFTMPLNAPAASNDPRNEANTPSSTNDQSHDLGLVLTRGGAHTNRGAGQHDGHHYHHGRKHHGHRGGAVQYGEHRIEDLALILHFLHAGSPVEDFGNDLILGRIAQFQP